MIIISFEGIDGVGKSSAIFQLSQFLSKHSIQHIVSRELADYEPLISIKKLLMRNDLSQHDELTLIMQARAWHLQNIILPATQENKLVIMDRFIDSTYAYQHDVSDAYIAKLHRDIDCPLPDYVFFMCGKSICRERDRIELKGSNFFSKVVNAYSKRQSLYKDRWWTFDNASGFEHINEAIQSAVLSIIG